MISKSAIPVVLLGLTIAVDGQDFDLYGREADAAVYEDPSQAVIFDKRTPYDWADYESFVAKRYAEPEFDLDDYGYDLYAREADAKFSLSKLSNQVASFGKKERALGY